MLDRNSRYANLDTATYTTSAGKTITYVTRRFLPREEDLTVLARVRTEEGDRLDRIAWRTLGNAELWWRVADASEAMNPFELVAEAETELVIPNPSGG